MEKQIELTRKYTPSGEEALVSMRLMVENKKSEDKIGMPKTKWGFSYFQKMYTRYRDIVIKNGLNVTGLPKKLKF